MNLASTLHTLDSDGIICCRTRQRGERVVLLKYFVKAMTDTFYIKCKDCEAHPEVAMELLRSLRDD